MSAVCPSRAMAMEYSVTPEMQGRVSGDAFAAVEAWAETWYRDESGRDRLSFDDIPCGDAIRVDVFEFGLEAANNALGLPSRRVGRPALRPLRARGLDREARAWGLRMVRLGHHQSGGRLPVSFVSEVTTPSALGSSMAVARELSWEQAAIGVTDPRGYRAWHRDGWNPVPLVLGAWDDYRVAKRARVAATEAWNEARRRCPPLFIGGRDLAPIVLRTMDRFVPRSLARLAVDQTAITRYLDAKGAGVAARLC